MPDEAVVTNEPVKAPADEGEAEEEPEIKIPARRMRASDDEAEEGADEFHDAENADEAGEHGDNLIGILRRPIRLPTISTKIFNFGDILRQGTTRKQTIPSKTRQLLLCQLQQRLGQTGAMKRKKKGTRRTKRVL